MGVIKKITYLMLVTTFFYGCKEEPKTSIPDVKETVKEVSNEKKEAVVKEAEEIANNVVSKSVKQVKEELTGKGFKIFEYVDEKTQDTVLMQQYFMAFLKKGPIRGQNEEEAAELQKEHLAHLSKMYEMGYADISGPFGDDGDIRGITIYNVPTLKIADSLANSDPMVKAGRLEIEIHPWWATKGFPLR